MIPNDLNSFSYGTSGVQAANALFKSISDRKSQATFYYDADENSILIGNLTGMSLDEFCQLLENTDSKNYDGWIPKVEKKEVEGVFVVKLLAKDSASNKLTDNPEIKKELDNLLNNIFKDEKS